MIFKKTPFKRTLIQPWLYLCISVTIQYMFTIRQNLKKKTKRNEENTHPRCACSKNC